MSQIQDNATMDDLTGRIIKTYELRERIGEGGFGAVYRAYQQLIGREVAIKIILPHHANHPDFIRRFETEAQLVARLEHPHIVPLYDYWREPSSAYLVMRWLRGGSVQDSLEKNGPWDVRTTSHLLTQICEALTVAHRQGVIHRDLKPENILLDENGNAYLSDFGIAKDLGGKRITQNNAILGSPAYLAPEQIRGESVTPQSDIYSMGIVLYEVLTGERPFDDASPASLMYKHLSEPLPDLNMVNTNIPSAVNAILQRTTAKDPKDRFENAIELAREFRHAIKRDGSFGDAIAIGTGFIERTTGSIVPPAPENPYKGLRAFQQADTDDFFGREVLTLSILKRMQEPVDSARFLAIVGPSGSGKSSVVKAGVIPELRRGAFPRSDEWFIVEMLPGIDPMEELEAALLRIAVNPPDSLLEQLNADERGLLRAIKRVLPDDDTELLIFIDQFEELFTLVDDESVRRQFMDSLYVAATDPRSRVRIVATLRADFYDRPLQYTRFGELMRTRTEVVLPMTAEELERSITGPARRSGLVLEEGLVTAIVADVVEQPGALPLLQYALTELFERRDGMILTVESYNEIGGTLGALARRADELYEGLGEEGREAARQMFMRLITLGEGTEDTRRRALQSELLSIGDDSEEMSMIIDAFGRYRLLTFDHDPSSRTATVEVAHEALIRQWTRLRDWLRESREDLRTQRRLTALADEWLNSGKDPSYLARGLRLQQLEAWQDNSRLALNVNEAAFLEASIQERRAREAEEQARKERETLLERRLRQRLQMLVAVMGIAAVVASVLAIFAFSQQQAAEDARAVAELNEEQAQSLALAANARNTLIQHETTLGLALAIAARDAYAVPPVEVLRVLAAAAYGPGVRARFEGHEGAVLAGDISDDGRLSVSASADGTLRIWDNQTRAQLQRIDMPSVIFSTVAFSPSGEQIIAGATDHNLYLFDLESREIIRQFEGHSDVVTRVVLTEDGTRALSGSLDYTMRLWDISTGETLQTFDAAEGIIFDVALSSDARYAASSYGDSSIIDRDPDAVRDRFVRVWDVDTGELIHTLDFGGQTGWVRTVTFSPDGKHVTAATWGRNIGGLITIWDVETGEEVQRIYGHSNLITGLEYTPNGRQLVSVSWDNTLRVWDLRTGIEIARFDVFNDLPLNVALSNDGEFALVQTGNIGGNEITVERDRSVDPSVWLIDLMSRSEIRTLTGHDEWVWGVDVSNDGRYAVSGAGVLVPESANPDFDHTVRLWDLSTGEEVLRLDPHETTIEAVRFSTDGTLLATGGWDGQVILWSYESSDTGPPALEEINRLTFPAPDDTTVQVLNVAFDPTDSIIAAGGSDGTVALWDTATGELLRQFGDHNGAVAGLEFSSDGMRLATGSYDGTAALWDPSNGARLLTLEGHLNRINDVAFLPDDTGLVTASWDNTIRLWDTATGETLRQFIGHGDRIQTVRVSTDGQYIYSGAGDTTMRMWDIMSGQEVYRFDGHTDWVSQVVILPDGQRALSSGQDNTLRLWRVPLSADEIIAWAEQERYMRELSCVEREQFRVEPYCTGEPTS
ncbi:MAG: protein kinase domain-containing protein [Chloroflexota bacterium]